jgi:hypothetical protein
MELVENIWNELKETIFYLQFNNYLELVSS